MGLGHFGGGVAAARWLARQGAIVTVTDTADAATWPIRSPRSKNAADRRDAPRRPPENDFRETDLVVVNPAVRPGNRFLADRPGRRRAADHRDRPVPPGVPAPVIGVTGTNGKSTTAAMTAAILGPPAAARGWAATSAAACSDELDAIGADDWVRAGTEQFSTLSTLDDHDVPLPHVAVVTNCTPNHLDWHGGYAAIRRGQAANSCRPDGRRHRRARRVARRGSQSWRRLVRGRRRHACAGRRRSRRCCCRASTTGSMRFGGARRRGGGWMRRTRRSDAAWTFLGLAAAVGVVAPRRRADVLQRHDGHHARVDHRRVASRCRRRSGYWPAAATRGSILRRWPRRLSPARGRGVLRRDGRDVLHDLVTAVSPGFSCVHASTHVRSARIGVGREAARAMRSCCRPAARATISIRTSASAASVFRRTGPCAGRLLWTLLTKRSHVAPVSIGDCCSASGLIQRHAIRPRGRRLWSSLVDASRRWESLPRGFFAAPNSPAGWPCRREDECEALV